MSLPAHIDLAPAWHDVRAELRRSVGESTYDIWLSGVEARAWDGVVLLLEAPLATRGWIAERFGRVLERAARSILGDGVRVAFAGEPANTAREAIIAAGSGTGHAEIATSFIPRYTFDQFIIGDGNRLAHAAALAVAEQPGHAHNPLFLYAPPGLGKTHLLHAIGNYINAFVPSATVRYTTVEAFTNGFISALHGRDLDRFKHLHRDVDVLLVDDVQFLASKAKTEEEFFHTFNAIHAAGRQLVLTSDRLPHQLTGLADRLRERFASGLVAELAPPDRAVRMAILRKRVALDRVELEDPGVLDLVADRVRDNIRSLEGALIRIVAHHSLTGRPIDLALARAVLDGIHPDPSGPHDGPPSVELIQELVAAHFDLTAADLRSPSRSARTAWARQLAMQLTRDLTTLSLQAIGAAFGGRNHATVLHASKRVSDRVATSSEDAAELSALRALIRR